MFDCIYFILTCQGGSTISLWNIFFGNVYNCLSIRAALEIILSTYIISIYFTRLGWTCYLTISNKYNIIKSSLIYFYWLWRMFSTFSINWFIIYSVYFLFINIQANIKKYRCIKIKPNYLLICYECLLLLNNCLRIFYTKYTGCFTSFFNRI